ncbi:hypothetical protein EVG20_g2973 [Dentipellis fragilis]|uniref:Fungal-type protein kinase domain-containing protein n=1 Tax=Dentipellis fragilis TaxID=205917 RepID=A0A4Y9Z770_9AGAM|nr:hypothetical protein EVG20_g2973 [Dentipellis fragilis]
MCDSELHLLRGLRGALDAHRSLCEMGFLHGNINAGNVLLYDERPKEGAQGLLLDVELALSKPSLTNRKETVNVPSRLKTSGTEFPTATRTQLYHESTSVMHGALMSDTTQFVSWEILTALHVKGKIRRQAHHDVESFVWVLAYSVMRLVAERMKADYTVPQDAIHEFQDLFENCFTPLSALAIANNRRAAQPLAWTCHDQTIEPDDDGRRVYEDAIRQMSKPLIDLFDGLVDDIWASTHPKSGMRTYLTHDKLQSRLDYSIAQLEKEEQK